MKRAAITLLTALTLSALTATPTLAERIHLPPVDQAAKDPDLVQYRNRLRAAIAARDTDAVLALACDDIFLSFGGNGGLAEFRQYLTVPPEMLSEEYRDQAGAMREGYWRDLENTLARPGYFDGSNEFWMPLYWQIELPEDMDPYTTYFVDGTQVLLRAGPSRSDPVVNRLSHELVTVVDYDPDSTYLKVRTGDGQSGYTHRDYLYSIIGYRAQLTRSGNGQWQLCTFVAGD